MDSASFEKDMTQRNRGHSIWHIIWLKIKKVENTVKKSSTTLKKQMQALGLVLLLWIWPLTDSFIPREISKDVSGTGKAGTEISEADEAGAEVPVRPMVALTFDDGPNAEYTEQLLDGLLKRDVKATFFVIGVNIEKEGNEKIIRRMYEEGHLIGNHTYHHVNLANLSYEDMEREIRMTDDLVREITGEEPFLVRPPFGSFPECAEEEDKLYVKWTVDSGDWSLKNTQEIVRRVVTDVEENDMILMHDCYETSVEAALQIVDILQAEGYEFVTADRLLMD